jgi:hypothetical protein
MISCSESDDTAPDTAELLKSYNIKVYPQLLEWENDNTDSQLNAIDQWHINNGWTKHSGTNKNRLTGSYSLKDNTDERYLTVNYQQTADNKGTIQWYVLNNSSQLQKEINFEHMKNALIDHFNIDNIAEINDDNFQYNDDCNLWDSASEGADEKRTDMILKFYNTDSYFMFAVRQYHSDWKE